VKILVGHNRYQSAVPSGENVIVDRDTIALRAAGVDVVTFLPESDALAGAGPLRLAGAAAGPIYSVSGVAALRRLIEDERPDVVHLHNVFPLISPWAVRTAHAAGIPVVHSMHNYRHTCVASTHLRDGAVCEDCTGRRVGWPGVVHRCYRGSAAQSAAMVVGQAVHRRTWRSVERFLVLSPFMAERCARLGVPAERIVVRTNPVPGPATVPPLPGSPSTVLFVGRLSPEKGADLLVDAWRRSGLGARGWTLVVAGTGECEADVRARAAGDDTVEFAGWVSGDELEQLYARSAIAAVPSRWYEGVPLTISEALARGRPVIVSDLGAMPGNVDRAASVVAAPTVDGWTQALAAVPGLDLPAMGRAARDDWASRLTPERGLATLLGVYDSVADRSRG
jgi:glycosyltransferase involved in cell wall biosynthesis